MVLGLKSKNRKGASIQVNYVIHVQEIKPWPPSQSLKAARSVLLQWESGDRSSGSLNPVFPLIGSGVSDGKIEFNESFKLTTILYRELSAKSGNELFQKNYLEFNLYESRSSKTVKGQHLGSVAIDLSGYGVIRETVILAVPMNCKRNFRNTAQPMLSVKIQPYHRENTRTSKEILSNEKFQDKEVRESVSALMNEEYADEAEIASFTDDDVSSHSSTTTTPFGFVHTDSTAQNEITNVEGLQDKEASKFLKESLINTVLESTSIKSVRKQESPTNIELTHQNGVSSVPSSIDTVPVPMSMENNEGLSNSHGTRFAKISNKSIENSEKSSFSNPHMPVEKDITFTDCSPRSIGGDKLVMKFLERIFDKSETNQKVVSKSVSEKEETNTNMLSSNGDSQVVSGLEHANIVDSEINEDGQVKTWRRDGLVEENHIPDQDQLFIGEQAEKRHMTYLQTGNFQPEKSEPNNIGDSIHRSAINVATEVVANLEEAQVNRYHKISSDALKKPSGTEYIFTKNDIGFSDRTKHMKSVKLSMLSLDGPASMNGVEEGKDIDVLQNACRKSIASDKSNRIQESRSLNGEKTKRVSRETQSNSDNKIRQLERRVETLESELRESAAVEIALYSIVAEHGSSTQKVHAPARRLSRIYLHASKQFSKERRASAARSAVSGLVLVAKACGNDVPRLTFWLSNVIVLRAIVIEAAGTSNQPASAGSCIETNGVRRKANGKPSFLKWEPALSWKEKNFFQNSHDWEDPQTFTAALEKIESWIFSRIIESVWWQILTPSMQSATQNETEMKMTTSILRKSYGKKPSVNDQEQENFPICHWKKAFKDAYEKICPVRAGRHECGCLSILTRMVMERCIARLDVAMFNAILREPEDEMPTDPVSDPISDLRVLPIPAGKSSFGTGVLLKNAVGNWSGWLADLFGIDGDSPLKDGNLSDDNIKDNTESFNSFLLLNALSGLLMLPKELLLDGSVRREVCPAFGAPLIKRVLSSFVPDEFCPDPIPEIVIEALDSEEPFEVNEESIRHFPCSASPILYSPPSAASVSAIIGELGNHSQLRKSRSSVLRKCQTSDDELDQLDSPFTLVVSDGIRSSPASAAGWKTRGNSFPNALRYRLLREVWRDGD